MRDSRLYLTEETDDIEFEQGIVRFDPNGEQQYSITVRFRLNNLKSSGRTALLDVTLPLSNESIHPIIVAASEHLRQELSSLADRMVNHSHSETSS